MGKHRLAAADHVEKVRVNPGNFAEIGGAGGKLYSDTEYQVELERIEEKFRPLVLKCKDRGVALRIGTNHGSLSERIVSRYGDTPDGMVESAMEFIYFAEAQDFNQIILSMKASNPQVMIHAYRRLAARLVAENRTYPLHLGVTEAGGGLEGRIKSASGVYSLLYDGLGDTIRVSLTESPVHEVPVAKSIVSIIDSNRLLEEENNDLETFKEIIEKRDPYAWTKPVRDGLFDPISPEKALVSYLAYAENIDEIKEDLRKINLLGPDRRPDVFWLSSDKRSELENEFRDFTFGLFLDGKIEFIDGYSCYRIDLRHYEKYADQLSELDSVFINYNPGPVEEKHSELIKRVRNDLSQLEEIVQRYPHTSLIISPNCHIGYTRIFHALMGEVGLDIPLILGYSEKEKDLSDIILESSGIIGALLLDGIGDGIEFDIQISPEQELEIAFNILQAARLRITQTEFISCPSCGRTLFDLEETTARIKSKTGHLKGLKIGVMGCIVNGPGEMADADFGYVGAGRGKINLYVGHELVKKNIPTDEADKELIDLIKSHNKWVEP